MAFFFYLTVNIAATHTVTAHSGSEHGEIDRVEVYESLLLGTNAWLSFCLASLFYILAIINVTFTSFVAFEQISMFYKELLQKEESIRV